MFSGASAFNQDIGNWDVSSGEDFVSIAMNTNAAMYKSNHDTHNLLLPFLVCSITCFLERLHLIETLVTGMCQVVKTL